MPMQALQNYLFWVFLCYFKNKDVILQPILNNSNAETKNEHIIETIIPELDKLWTGMLCLFVKAPDT